MVLKKSGKSLNGKGRQRRTLTEEFKAEAV
jgi:hypothetical protein